MYRSMRRRCRVGCSFAGKILRVGENSHWANGSVDFIIRSPPPASSPPVERVPGWARSVVGTTPPPAAPWAKHALRTTEEILERGALELLDRDQGIAVEVGPRATFHRFYA